eukprot:2419636-Amphidinium_carterae.1
MDSEERRIGVRQGKTQVDHSYVHIGRTRSRLQLTSPTRACSVERMRRSHPHDRADSSGRSRSSRYVEEEVDRMMRRAEASGCFDTSLQSMPPKRRELTSSSRAGVRRVEHSSVPADRQRRREVKLEDADQRVPLKRRKQATPVEEPRTHHEHPDRYARRMSRQQRGDSPPAQAKPMPSGKVATGSNTTPLPRAILRPREHSRGRPPLTTEENEKEPMEVFAAQGASAEQEEVLHVETYETLRQSMSPPWLPDYIRGAMVMRERKGGVKELACRLCIMNIGGRKEKWYKDWGSLWEHFKACHHKRTTQTAMVLHLAERWQELTDTHRESGLGWTLQYYDTRPPEHSTW